MLQERLLAFAQINTKFAIGLSQGIGLVYNYLDLVQRQEILEWANKNENFAEGFGKSLGEIFTPLTRSVQYELLQAIKKGESNLLDSFGKSISANFNYLDLELQDQILSLQKINSAFIPSVNTSMSPTDCSTSVQDNNNHYPVIKYEDLPRISFQPEDTLSLI
ncbi:MAG TPA: hypothetical protein VIY08_04270 [Candidatus Nitrosocosmicus sp.]